ncbi:MAG: hypothetical protein FWE20_01830 [Defluviitaleaceae bacterium]|nr:hypothetical protein [Defluviitaleaceae bacterium]
MKVAIMATSNEDRFKSRKTKYLHEVIDKPLIAYSIEQAKSFSPEIVVVGRENNELKTVVEGLGAQFVEEGAAAGFFAAFGDQPVLIFEADDIWMLQRPYPPSSHDEINRLVRLHKMSGVPTYIRDDHHSGTFYLPLGSGRGENIPMPWDSAPFVAAAKHFAPLPQVLKAHPNAEPYHLPHYYPQRVFSLWDISHVVGNISGANIANLAAEGVVFQSMHSVTIGADVTIEADAVIYSNVEITGKTHIGSGTIIRSGTRIHNMTIGAGCEIEQSVLLDSTIGDGTSVGPFAYIRPGSRIGSNCRIGDFVEVKNSTIGDSSKASHLGYIGDSIIGSNVNFGCGSITVNYDGANKSATVIEDGVFVGSNSNLVAPVRLGENSFVAAGSTVTRDVPPGDLAVGRSRQENKSGWKRPFKK